MANVESTPFSGMTAPPNEGIKDGDPKCGSSSLGRSASPVRPPNETIKNGDAMGSWGEKREKNDIKPPDHRFEIKDAKMPQPPSVMQPGKGAIPIAPNGNDSSAMLPGYGRAKK